MINHSSFPATRHLFLKQVVLKSTLVKPKAKAKLQVEVKVHSSLRHKGVVRFYHFFEDGGLVCFGVRHTFYAISNLASCSRRDCLPACLPAW